MSQPTLDPGFSTAEMSRVFSPRGHIAGMLQFEAALAEAQSDAGLIDPELAEEIAVRCRTVEVDASDTLARGWVAGTPLLPLLDEIRAGLTEKAGELVHHGATSQDAIDTALVLQARVGIDAMRAGLIEAGSTISSLARDHAATPTMAWTLLQPAMPITLGARFAGWLTQIVDRVASLDEARGRLGIQLGGPSGDRSSWGSAGSDVAGRLATRLGLAAAPPWHTDRTAMHSLVATVASAAATAGKIAGDVALLAYRGEIRSGAGGSSSMPHKRNPIDAVRARAAAYAATAHAGAVLSLAPIELERGAGSWQAEWHLLPLVFQTAGASVEAMGRAVASLEVDPGAAPDVEPLTGASLEAAAAMIDRVAAHFEALEQQP